MFLNPFSFNLYNVAGYIVLLKGSTAIVENLSIFNDAKVGGT